MQARNPESLQELKEWLTRAPAGTQIDARVLLLLLEELGEVPEPAAGNGDDAGDRTWRERLWKVPGDTRIGTVELCEALGRPRSWVYRHTSLRSGCTLLPHRKLDGQLVFVAGEIRAWLRENEEIVERGRAA